MSLLPPDHRIDFRGDSESEVAAKFGAANFCRELSQIPPTVCVIILKVAFKQVFMAFGKFMPNHCFVGKKYARPLSCVL